VSTAVAAPLPDFPAAVLQARTVAAIARTRAARHSAASPAGDALRTIADHLDVAARVFETDPTPCRDGIPSGAWAALADAEDLAAAHPGIGFPPRFGQYITQSLTGNPIDLPAPLNPALPGLASQEANLHARLRTIHDQLAASNSTAHAALFLHAAFTLHRKHVRIADAVRAHDSRP